MACRILGAASANDEASTNARAVACSAVSRRWGPGSPLGASGIEPGGLRSSGSWPAAIWVPTREQYLNKVARCAAIARLVVPGRSAVRNCCCRQRHITTARRRAVVVRRSQSGLRSVYAGTEQQCAALHGIIASSFASGGDLCYSPLNLSRRLVSSAPQPRRRDRRRDRMSAYGLRPQLRARCVRQLRARR